MSNKEDQQEITTGVEVLFELQEQVDDVQRKPATDEDRHHGDQHPVGTALPVNVQLFALAILHSHFGSGAHAQRLRHLDVAEGDDAARDDVLKNEARDGEELARR